MCIIAIKPKEKAMFTDATIQQMFDRNPHGAGLMFTKSDGTVHVEKGFFSSGDVIRYVHDNAKALKDTDVIMHFRIATSGKKDALGCHPYPVWSNNIAASFDTKLAMCHNGVLDGYGWRGNDEVNDTQVFIKETLRKLPHNFLKNKGILELIGRSIGTNKLAFLDSEGIHTIGSFINDDGYLFSNDSYKPPFPFNYGMPYFAKEPVSVKQVKTSSTNSKGTKSRKLSDYKTTLVDDKVFNVPLTKELYDKVNKKIAQSKSTKFEYFYGEKKPNRPFTFSDRKYYYCFTPENRVVYRLPKKIDCMADFDDYLNGLPLDTGDDSMKILNEEVFDWLHTNFENYYRLIEEDNRGYCFSNNEYVYFLNTIYNELDRAPLEYLDMLEDCEDDLPFDENEKFAFN